MYKVSGNDNELLFYLRILFETCLKLEMFHRRGYIPLPIFSAAALINEARLNAFLYTLSREKASLA